MNRVMAVGIEPQATTGTCFPRELACGRIPDEGDELTVDVIQLPAYVGERQAALLLGHPRIERINTAICGDVAWWPAARDDQRQML